MNKKQIRLTESDLKQIVKESVSKILNEDNSKIIETEKLSNAMRQLYSAIENLGKKKDGNYIQLDPKGRK